MARHRNGLSQENGHRMNKEQYLQEVRSDIDALLTDVKLSNHKNQVFAWKLNARFNKTFEESFLWSKALFLATNSCLLIQNNSDRKIAIKGLHECAEIYESLSLLPEISENFDRDYLSILSALCYDLSGYQANAYCVANRIQEYELSTQDERIVLAADNKVVEQIRLILLKKIPLAYDRLPSELLSLDTGYSLFRKAMTEWFQYLLNQKETDFAASIESAYLYYLHVGNTYLSHLLFLLKTRTLLFGERSIWNRLKDHPDIANSSQWKKYVRLLSYDYYGSDSAKNIHDRRSVFEFWPSQLRSIEKGLLDLDESFVVQMPTSAGKTFIAELLLLKYLVKYPNKKCIYIAPFRALTSEKETELSKYFSKIGYSVSSLSGSYEIDEFQDVILSETDLLIATPEKVDLLLRLNADFFENLSCVVIDEGHIIGDISTRAALLEFLIIRLRIRLPDLKTLFISAVMPPENANDYAIWLSGKESNVLRSLRFNDSGQSEEWEPTRKLISFFQWTGSRGDITFQNVTTEDEKTKIRHGAKLFSFLRDREFGNKFPKTGVKKEAAAALALKLSAEGNTLVFCAQVPRVKSVAKALLSLLSIIEAPHRFRFNEDKKSSYYAKLWYGHDSYITESINNGIGIHYGDMPEQVRNAVEDDFRNGSLTVVLSTNTIGQGLNFPIKNIVFYETQIDRKNNQNIYIQNRDFWNIVGRAGRAGKETEGKIVFIMNSTNDRKLYSTYTNKDNLEEAQSLIFKVLDALLEGRITPDVFSNYVSILSETYLLDLVSEESIGTEHEEVISSILNNSLFKTQVDKRKIDIGAVKTEFRKIFKSFESEASFQEISKYRITGLSFSSNRIIDSFIEVNKDSIQELIGQDDWIGISDFFLKLISENDIPEMSERKLDNLGLNPISYKPIVESWTNGQSISDLITLWRNSTNLDIDDFHIFISKGLYYLYPWGLSAFLIILAYKIEIQFTELPENIKNLPSFVKYGLNNSTGCLARSLGVKSRQVALLLFERSSRRHGKDFVKWLSNLTIEEIETFGLSQFDAENLREVCTKITPNSHRADSAEFQFVVKGTSFNTEWAITSKEIQFGELLNYRRDEENLYDPYAIFVLRNENPIGYVPREYSRIIASAIDIENKNFRLIATEIVDRGDYSEIRALMQALE